VQTPKQIANGSRRCSGPFRGVRIDRQEKSVAVRDLATGQSTSNRTTSWFSVGRRAGSPANSGRGCRVFTLRSLTDMDAIRRPSMKRTRSGCGRRRRLHRLEMTEALVERAIQCPGRAAAPGDGNGGPEMHFPCTRSCDPTAWSCSSHERHWIEESGSKLLNVRLSDGQTRQAGLAIMSVGVKPDVQLARDAGLKIGQRGGIVVDDHMQTSDPSIFVWATRSRSWTLSAAFDADSAGRPRQRQGRIAPTTSAAVTARIPAPKARRSARSSVWRWRRRDSMRRISSESAAGMRKF